MKISVLVEPVAEGRFRVSDAGLLSISVEGDTEEEAVKKYREAVTARLVNGRKIVTVSLPGEESPDEHPWMRFAGTLPDDELTQEWLKAIEEYRRQRDAEDSSLP